MGKDAFMIFEWTVKGMVIKDNLMPIPTSDTVFSSTQEKAIQYVTEKRQKTKNHFYIRKVRLTGIRFSLLYNKKPSFLSKTELEEIKNHFEDLETHVSK